MTASIATIALWLGLSFTAAAQLAGLASTRRAISTPQATTLEAQLIEAARNGASDELASLLQGIAAEPQMEPAAREWLLDRGLQELARLSPTPAASAVVDQLERRAPSVFVRADPDHGAVMTPLYDVGATARFTRHSWQRAQARDETGAALLAGLDSPVEHFARRPDIAGPDPTREGIADAFAAAPLAQLARQRDAITTAMGGGRRVDELALITGSRLHDRELLDLVLGFADAPVALAAAQEVARTLDSGTALESLAIAARRPDIASAALLEIGKLARQEGAARDYLFHAIDDPLSGPSAAAALGSLREPSVALEIGQRLRHAKSELAHRLLALALSLDGTPAARDELHRFAATGAGSPALRDQVREWLAH